ncbi:EthD domain-containing protein [Sphingomonas jatrophae]|uniref:EthD domain-containing protein n=1 Tax=Sphingomonas jatrophae TaxID=1166337 RepID=A0A1I6KKR4_9SPHN|nr:EthD domain-containing protein [Sphingomonas jatrophae]SFR91845.1 conserved hypothetical protein [Sphingomonas jatrophae]
MSKSICVMGHRPGTDRAFFQCYYEANHAPLGRQHFPFTRYVRNHLIDGDDLAFDTISEFWADDIAAAAGLMNGPVGDILRADEEKFVDRPQIASAGADEHVLSPGSPGEARTATLIARGQGDEAAFREGVLAWGRTLAAEMPAVSLDFVIAWREPAFPAAAVLWTPQPPGDAPAGLTVRHLHVRRCETPPELLLGNAAAG